MPTLGVTELPGFYRTLYDEAHMAAFGGAMSKGDSSLNDIDQGSIVADLHHAAIAGQVDVVYLLDLMPKHGASRLPLLWTAKVDFLTALRKVFWEQPKEDQDVVKAYAVSMVGPLYDELGFDARPQDTADIKVLRNTVVSAAVSFDYAPAVKQVRQRFKEWVYEGRRDNLDPAMLSLVLDNVCQIA